MDHFHYHNGKLYSEEVLLEQIVDKVGTPCYVYSRAAIENNWKAFDRTFGDHPHQVCYAVKANGNLAILNLLMQLGSGFDIVSGGELARVIAAGGTPADIIFSGVGKQEWEIKAAIEAGIGCFNIESEGELQHISSIAVKMGKRVPITVRLNPDIDTETHPYITTGMRSNKFGLAAERALAVYRQAQQSDAISIQGIACHIGSQLTDLLPFVDALKQILIFIDQLAEIDISVNHINLGGGLGVRYGNEQPPTPKQYWQALRAVLEQRTQPISITFEPGRAIVANAGLLLTRVCYLKAGEVSNFCIVDAAMNDLIRPALYQGWHHIEEVDRNHNRTQAVYDVVGPICESSDFLAKQRTLNVAIDDLLAVHTAGAYCAAMSSNYNARPRPAEVMVDGNQFHIIRQRESLETLYRGETILPT